MEFDAEGLEWLCSAATSKLIRISLQADLPSKGNTQVVCCLPLPEMSRRGPFLRRSVDRVVVFIGVAEFDLRQEANYVWERLQQMKKDDPFKCLFDVDPEFETGSACNDFLREFSDWGGHVHRRLFQRLEILDHTREHAEELRAFLLETIGEGSNLTLATNLREQIAFPWPLVFDERARALDWRTKFWGYRHRMQEECRVYPINDRIRKRPRICIAIDRDRDVRKLHDDSRHPFHDHESSCETIELATKEIALTTLSKCNADAFYHFGHLELAASAVGNKIHWGLCSLSVSDMESSKCPDFERDAVLAFFNACQSAAADQVGKDTFLGRFMQGRRTHCLVTLNEVPWGLAAKFSLLFWQAFLKSQMTVGEAILDARLQLLRAERSPNPLGLLYNYYGKLTLAASN